MIFPHPEDPDSNKHPKKRRENLLRIWFYCLIIIPLFYIYFTDEWFGLSSLLGTWTSIVALPFIVAGILELVINASSKTRPLISINLRFLVVASSFVAIILVSSYFRDQNEQISQTQLQTFCDEVNDLCPQMIDEYSRLDNLIALSGNAVQYNYTLPEYGKDDREIDLLKMTYQRRAIEFYNTSPDLEGIRAYDIAIIHLYKDKNGVEVFKVIVPVEHPLNSE